MNLTNFIIWHDENSFRFFIENNPGFEDCEFLCVGNKITDFIGLTANRFDDNLEHYPSLLAFTAWYLIAKNDLCKTFNVGIFEYDVKFNSIPEIEHEPKTIYGFIKRRIPDTMYLDCVPDFKKQLTVEQYSKAINQKHWNATSNFIMPVRFLKDFVDWYLQFIPEILQYKDHGHYHERAVNVYAALSHYQNKSLPLITHFQKCSHGYNI